MDKSGAQAADPGTASLRKRKVGLLDAACDIFPFPPPPFSGAFLHTRVYILSPSSNFSTHFRTHLSI